MILYLIIEIFLHIFEYFWISCYFEADQDIESTDVPILKFMKILINEYLF